MMVGDSEVGRISADGILRNCSCIELKMGFMVVQLRSVDEGNQSRAERC